jgi:hypothetical protein
LQWGFGSRLEEELGRVPLNEDYHEWAKTWIAGCKAKRLLLLAKRLGIEVKKPEDWALAMLKLAEVVCPSFTRVVSSLDKRHAGTKGAPRGRRAPGPDWPVLVEKVERRVAKGAKVLGSCGEVAREHNADPSTLRVKYYSIKKQYRMLELETSRLSGGSG